MKAYVVRNVHNISDAIEKLERAFVRRHIHFLDVKHKSNKVRITLLDMSNGSARIREVEFYLVHMGDGAIRFYENKS